MNIRHIPACLLAIALLTGCSSNAGKDAADTAAPTDATTDTAAAQAPADTTAQQPEAPHYLSDDLRQFSLLGPVKSVSTETKGNFYIITCLNEKLTFTREGKLTTKFGEYTDNKLSHNPDGLVSATHCRESDGTEFDLKFTKWDADDLPVAGTYTDEGPGLESSYTLTLAYGRKDSHGNWLDCKVTYKGSDREINDQDGWDTTPSSGTFTIVRKLTYWD